VYLATPHEYDDIGNACGEQEGSEKEKEAFGCHYRSCPTRLPTNDSKSYVGRASAKSETIKIDDA
jgi:hypothetical protein